MNNRSVLRLSKSLAIVFDRPNVLMLSIIVTIMETSESLTIPCISESMGYSRENTTIERLVNVLVRERYLNKNHQYEKMKFISLSDKTKKIII